MLVAVFTNNANCDDLPVKTNLAPINPIEAAKLVDDPNLEGRFGYSGYARNNGYGYANNDRVYQPGIQVSTEQNQKRFNPPINNYGPQTFQNGQNNPNPMGVNRPTGYGGVTYGKGAVQGQDQGQGFGNSNFGQVGHGGFGLEDQYNPNIQSGFDSVYGQPNNNNFGHHVHRYGQHDYPHKPYQHGHGYGYYYKYGQDGKYDQDGFGQDNYGYQFQPDFIRYLQGHNQDRSNFDYGSGSFDSQPSFDHYDDRQYYWNRK